MGGEYSLSQFIGVGFVLVGILGVVYLSKRGRLISSYVDDPPNSSIAV